MNRLVSPLLEACAYLQARALFVSGLMRGYCLKGGGVAITRLFRVKTLIQTLGAEDSSFVRRGIKSLLP
jgi:hypothetical protein